MAAKRIGILTGGGDVPGLNSVIKTVVYRGSEIGCEVIGIRRGWEGLTHVNLQDPASRTRYVLPLNRENTRTIDRTGGTYLHSSRTNPSKMKKLPPVLEGQEFPEGNHHQKGRDLRSLRRHQSRPQEHRNPQPRLPHRHRRRRYPQLCRRTRSPGLPRHRRPQDDGQRCAATPSTASASPPPSPAPWTPSSASAPPSARTNASASSASSAATPATPRSTPPTSPASAAASRNTKSISTS